MYFLREVTQSRYKYGFCVEFLDGGKWEQHFPVLLSGNIAQFTNFMELLILPFKRGGRVSRHPLSSKAEVVTHWNLKVKKHATSPFLSQFPYCKLCDNANDQSNHRLLSVSFHTTAIFADFSNSPK